MKRFFRTLAVLCLLAVPSLAQYTTVTASHIGRGDGTLLPKGTVCFSVSGNPSTGYHIGSTGQSTGEPVCRDVVNGVIMTTYKNTTVGTLQVADTSQTSPVNICYAVSVKDASGNPVLGIGQVSGYGCVQPSGASFDFDAFIPNLPAQPLGGSVTNLHVQNLVVDNCTGAGCGSGGGSGGNITSVFGRTGVITAQSGDYSVAQITNALSKVLSNGHIFVGNASNVATDVAVSGDCTISNAGALDCTKTGGTPFATVATSGSYNDLSNKPSIPAAQVNSDWNAVSGLAQILNKPSIPAAQVNSDWNAVSGLAEILNKPTLGALAAKSTVDYLTDVTNTPTLGTAAGLASSGNGTKAATTNGLSAGDGAGVCEDAAGNLKDTGCTSGGSVSSFNGRTGIVTPTTGDYSYSQISSTPQLPVTNAGASHNFLTSYDASTGLFTKAQPDYSDITNTPALATVATSGSYNDLSNKPSFMSNALTSAFIFVGNVSNVAAGVAVSGDCTLTNAGVFTCTKTNGTSFATVATSGSYPDLSSKPTLAQTNAGASHNFLTSYDASTGLFTKAQPAYSDISGTPTLATVATSGLYSDLLSKPTLAQTNSGAAHNFITAYDATTGLLTKAQPACGDLSNAGDACAKNTGSTTGTLAAGDDSRIVNAVPNTRQVNGHALSADVTVSKTDVGLSAVTNDAQTKAAVVPNTAPSAGQLPAGNAGGTAYAPVSLSGAGDFSSCTFGSSGILNCTLASTVVKNNQSNTFSTGDQNFSSSTSMETPNTRAGAATTSTVDQGGQDVTSATAGTMGTKTIRGADVSDAGGTTGQTAGAVIIRGGDNAAAGTSGINAGGNISMRPGGIKDGSTGNDTVPGYLSIEWTGRKGATYTGSGLGIGGNLGCITGHNTVQDLSACGPFQWLGINLAAILTTGADVQMYGTTTMLANSSTAFVNGDVVCTDTAHLGKVLDNGINPCACPSTQVGFVDLTFTNTFTTVTFAHQGMCVSSTSQTTNQWIDSIDPTTGTPHKSQPDFSNLSGQATPSQMPWAYRAPITSRNTSMSAATMVASPSAGATYVLYLSADAVDGGTGCTGTGSVAFTLAFKSNDSGLTISQSMIGFANSAIISTSLALPTTVGGLTSADAWRAFPFTFTTASGTAVTLATTYTPGSGCTAGTTGQNYAAHPVLYQIN